MMQSVRHAVLLTTTWMPKLPPETRRRILRACDVNVGPGTHIHFGCHFTPGTVTIGANSFVNFRCTFDASAPITIGDGVGIGFETQLITSTHQIADATRRAGAQDHRPITIQDGCWLGAGVKVLPGVTIGRGCVIAAGAVVTKDCAPHGIYAGTPARRLRDLDQEAPNPRRAAPA